MRASVLLLCLQAEMFQLPPNPAGEEGFVEANAVDEVDFERERAQGGEKEVKP